MSPVFDLTTTLCSGLTGTGVQSGVSVEGFDKIVLEVVAVGTVAAQAVSLQIESSFDNFAGTNDSVFPGLAETAYNHGSSAGETSLTRVTGSWTITPGNATYREVYAVQDYVKWLRVNVTANTLSGTGAGLTINVYGLPE